MALRLIVFLIITTLVGCRTKTPLKEAQFMEAIEKIHECEAYHELKLASNNLTFLESCKNQALKDLNISIKDFEQTTQYYKANPKEFEALYDTLLLKYP